jgi:hypothetical protein
MTPSDLRRTDSGEKNRGSLDALRSSCDGANPKAHSLVERVPSFVQFGEKAERAFMAHQAVAATVVE